MPADEIYAHATRIADQVEPRFRHGARSYGCGGHVAKLWGAAWEGACIALGGDPAAYRTPGGRGQPAPTAGATMPETVDSTSDDRTVNNVMRHAYRVLSDEEKGQMQRIKDEGLNFHDLLTSIGSSREISLAKTKIEEAVMWAVKHVTA